MDGVRWEEGWEVKGKSCARNKRYNLKEGAALVTGVASELGYIYMSWRGREAELSCADEEGVVQKTK